MFLGVACQYDCCLACDHVWNMWCKVPLIGRCIGVAFLLKRSGHVECSDVWVWLYI